MSGKSGLWVGAKTVVAYGSDAKKSTAIGKLGATALLTAEHRIEQLEMENRQLQSALTQAPQLNTIDNTHFFKLFVSLHLVLTDNSTLLDVP